jgi:hypothetical protein
LRSFRYCGATFIVSPHLTTAAELFEKEKARISRKIDD